VRSTLTGPARRQLSAGSLHAPARGVDAAFVAIVTHPARRCSHSARAGKYAAARRLGIVLHERVSFALDRGTRPLGAQGNASTSPLWGIR
jgi:hypothetical protein